MPAPVAVLTNVGRNWVCARLGASGGLTFATAFYLNWGNGSGATATVTDTTISGEIAVARVAGSAAQATTTVTNDTLQVTADIVADAAHTVDNVGVLDASSGGNLLLKASFNALAVLTGDRVSFTFKLIFV